MQTLHLIAQVIQDMMHCEFPLSQDAAIDMEPATLSLLLYLNLVSFGIIWNR